MAFGSVHVPADCKEFEFVTKLNMKKIIDKETVRT